MRSDSGRPRGELPVQRLLDLRLSVAPDAPSAARHAIVDALASIAPKRLVADVSLLASELVTNAVSHAGLEDSHKICVTLRLAGSSVRLEVANPGTGGTVALRNPSVDGLGGFGLQLVAALSSRWGVERHPSTSVWAEFDR